MFSYVSTCVLVCTVATIVMSQLIHPPNLLLLQDWGLELFLERLQTFGLGDLGDLCIPHIRVTTNHKVRSGDSTH